VAKTVSIPLENPLKGHGGVSIDAVIVREPTYNEFMQHGDPFIWVPLESGGAFASETPDVLAAYAAILVTEPKDKLLLEQGGFELARKIRSTIMGFFLPVAADKEGSPK
jgi:hypothetical protein